MLCMFFAPLLVFINISCTGGCCVAILRSTVINGPWQFTEFWWKFTIVSPAGSTLHIRCIGRGGATNGYLDVGGWNKWSWIHIWRILNKTRHFGFCPSIGNKKQWLGQTLCDWCEDNIFRIGKLCLC